MKQELKVYTDGSCHTQLLLGAWVAILLINEDKIILSGLENNTSHNRMELLAVIKALAHLKRLKHLPARVVVYSDSQYVVRLPERMKKLEDQKFRTRAGNEIQNADLVMNFRESIAGLPVEFIKVKAHQKNGDLLNREADVMVRKMLRKEIERRHE
ncbi:MAG: ribonuclease HI [bacterium]|nr:ribonuclease HI [bacterium]